MTNSNEPMNDEELERDLENFLVGDSPLSALYAEQSNEQTPPELDRLVITAAQKKTRPAKNTKQATAAKTTKPKRSPRWIKPIAAAATIVLGLALTLDLLQDQAVVQENDGAGLTNQRTSNSPALDETTNEQIEIRKDRSSFSDRAAPAGSSQARSAPAKAAKSGPKPEAIAPNAKTNATDEESEPQQAQAQQQEVVPKRDTAEPLVPAEPVAPAKPQPKQEPKRTAPQIETPEPEPVRERKTQSAPEPKPQSAPKPSPQQPPAKSEQPASEPIAPSANQKQVSPPPAPTNRDDQDLILPDNPPRAAEPRPDAANSPDAADSLEQPQPAAAQQEPEYRASPQSWIRHIVFLADTGQSAQAVAELRMFRSKYPQAPVPAELDGLGTR